MQRIQKVKMLVDNGYSHRVLFSHAIYTKHRLVSVCGIIMHTNNSKIGQIRVGCLFFVQLAYIIFCV